jgi:hypothetical protein
MKKKKNSMECTVDEFVTKMSTKYGDDDIWTPISILLYHRNQGNDKVLM